VKLGVETDEMKSNFLCNCTIIVFVFLVSFSLYAVVGVLFYNDPTIKLYNWEMETFDHKKLWIDVELVSFPIMVIYFMFASFYLKQNIKRNKKRIIKARNRSLLNDFTLYNENNNLSNSLFVIEEGESGVKRR
jgi:uncharacterized membrane protein